MINELNHDYRILIPKDAIYIRRIDVSYSPSSGIVNIGHNTPFCVRTNGAQLTVETKRNMKIKIVTLDGKVCMDRYVDGIHVYNLPYHGVYAIKGDDLTVKIVY